MNLHSKSPAGAILNQKFWKNFATRYWEKKPGHFKNIQSSLQALGPEQIFTMLVEFSDHCRKIKNAEGFKFYIKGEKVYADDVLQILPRKKDRSLQAYHQRMQKLFSDYCLVCDELLQVSAENKPLLTSFTRNLYQQVGFPNRFAEMGLYLGNYKKTPFGVHVDGCGVFSFPVVGQKKFRLWSAKFAAENPSLDRSFEYSEFKKDSEVMIAEVGDMTYWPSSAWHIAESDGSFSATWSLGVWVDESHAQKISSTVLEVLEKNLGPAGQAAMIPFSEMNTEDGQIKTLPPTYLKTMQALQELSSQKIQEVFLRDWAQHVSRQGLKPLDSRASAAMTENLKKLLTNKSLRLRHLKSPILWFYPEEATKKKIAVVFAGEVLESVTSPDFVRLIQDLNRGQSCDLKAYKFGRSKNQVYSALELLAKAGAFVKV